MWLRMTFNCTGKQPEAGNVETENTMFKETFTALAIVAGLVATGAQARDGDDRMQERFSQIDVNSDGQVTTDEMRVHAAARFAENDADGNGALSLDEITKGMQGKHKERLLKRFDTNGDGALSAEELAAMDNDKGNSRAAKHFERMDADKSGDITLAEMEGRRDPAKMVEKLDADNNGSLSLEEFSKARGHGKHGHGKHNKDRKAD